MGGTQTIHLLIDKIKCTYKYPNVSNFYISLKYFTLNFYLLVWERETSICCSTYLGTHWLIPVCALTTDGNCYLGEPGRRSDHMRYGARADTFYDWVKLDALSNENLFLPSISMDVTENDGPLKTKKFLFIT